MSGETTPMGGGGGVFLGKGGSKTALEGACVVGRWAPLRAAPV